MGNASSLGTTTSQTAFTPLAYTLPYIEQTNLQNLVNFTQPVMLGSAGTQTLNPVQAQAAGTVVKLFLCPSDGQTPTFTAYNSATWAGTNYVANAGTGQGTYYDERFPNDGIFWQGSNTSILSITDGTSNTLLMSETLLGAGYDSTGSAPAVPNRQEANVSATVIRPASPGPGTQIPLTPQICWGGPPPSWDGDRGASWIWGQFMRCCFNTYLPINSTNPDCLAHGKPSQRGTRARSSATTNRPRAWMPVPQP
jgi:hypothetical protein